MSNSASRAVDASPTLSVAIPIYNFSAFIVETLESIVSQDGFEQVEVVVVDGASTDDTPSVMEKFQSRRPTVKYVRLPQKGGIDRDMAKALSLTSGDYCWLFSGDDVMRPGALREALQAIQSGADVYLCKHNECARDMTPLQEWPVMTPDKPDVFDLANPTERARYFSYAVNTEPFFSFMGGIVVKRATWDRVPFNEAFNGSCWAHVARLFELMPTGLTLHYMAKPWLDRRSDNDSFMGRGFVARMALAIDGYHRLGDTFFGHNSVEARHIRRVIRHEFGIGMLMMGKFLCSVNPQVEKRDQLNALVKKAYGDWTVENLRMRWRFWRTPPETFKKWQREVAEQQERDIAERRKLQEKLENNTSSQ